MISNSMRDQVAIRETSFPYHHLRGQVATEFMLYLSVFMLITIAAFLVVSSLQQSEVALQENKLVKEIGSNFVNALTLSVKGGEGFVYTYRFPQTVFGIPYTLNLTHLTRTYNQSITINWEGSYGNFTYDYYVPAYNYQLSGTCLSDLVLVSNNEACSNTLRLSNDGEMLIITQE